MDINQLIRQTEGRRFINEQPTNQVQLAKRNYETNIYVGKNGGNFGGDGGHGGDFGGDKSMADKIMTLIIKNDRISINGIADNSRQYNAHLFQRIPI